jgi:hypothetical protein
LRHYATCREVPGLSLDEVIESFQLPNPSNRTMALRGLTQPLTEMSNRKCFWGVESGKADVTAICVPNV